MVTIGILGGVHERHVRLENGLFRCVTGIASKGVCKNGLCLKYLFPADPHCTKVILTNVITNVIHSSVYIFVALRNGIEFYLNICCECCWEYLLFFGIFYFFYFSFPRTPFSHVLTMQDRTSCVFKNAHCAFSRSHIVLFQHCILCFFKITHVLLQDRTLCLFKIAHCARRELSRLSHGAILLCTKSEWGHSC